MSNLMVTHGGALGDNGFTIPALTELRKIYDEIYLSCKEQAYMALKDTDLIDRFIIHGSDISMKATWEERRNWLIHVTRDIDFHAKLNFNGVIPGRYMFHKGDPKFHLPSEWKRENCIDWGHR